MLVAKAPEIEFLLPRPKRGVFLVSKCSACATVRVCDSQDQNLAVEDRNKEWVAILIENLVKNRYQRQDGI